MMTINDFKYKQPIFYFSSKTKAKLKFKLDNIIITKEEDGSIIQQQSCHNTLCLCVIGNISFTNVILQKAQKYGFPVIFLSRSLKQQGYFHNRAEGNFLLRQKQYLNKDKDLPIAQQIITQKIHNQTQLLKDLRYKAEADKIAIEKLTHFQPINCQNEKELLGIEGNASKVFFSAYFRTLNWQGRQPRCKKDINNLLLDIGYTYLFNFVETITAIYGFDIYCGVYHKFFYQRKSLICDLVEPFRCIIDRRLRKMHSLKQIHKDDFFFHQGQFKLEYKKQSHYTKIFMNEILDYKEDIFLFIQSYYRWYMKGKTIEQFPLFDIGEA